MHLKDVVVIPSCIWISVFKKGMKEEKQQHFLRNQDNAIRSTPRTAGQQVPLAWRSSSFPSLHRATCMHLSAEAAVSRHNTGLAAEAILQDSKTVSGFGKTRENPQILLLSSLT